MFTISQPNSATATDLSAVFLTYWGLFSQINDAALKYLTDSSQQEAKLCCESTLQPKA